MSPSLAELHAKCEPYGECLLWTGGRVNEGGQPRIWIDQKPISARRFVFGLTRGEIVAGRRIGMLCGECLCLQPGHMKQMTTTELLTEHHRRMGGLPPSHIAAVTAASRRRQNNKMDMEIARAIRASSEPTHVLATRYSLDKSTVCKVRRNERWAEHARGAFIFSM